MKNVSKTPEIDSQEPGYIQIRALSKHFFFRRMLIVRPCEVDEGFREWIESPECTSCESTD